MSFLSLTRVCYFSLVDEGKRGRGAKIDGHLSGRRGQNPYRFNEPFGLINVGDASGLYKLCEEHPEDLAVTDREFSDSLLRRVNSGDSTLNVLIGSKKFSEGWSSWHVSTMGLMNIGKKEGSQIIQLFDRGVRMKRLDFCLKQSHRVGFNAPKDIERLETLNVSGIHADYMRQFKEYLEDEGLQANEDRIEFVLPVVKNLGKKPLKTIRLREGIDFKKQGPNPTLDTPDKHLKKSRLVVHWYPKIQALASARGQATLDTAAPNEAWFTPDHLAFPDGEELYFDLQRFKSGRAWYNLNLNLSMDRIPGLLADNSWYVLHIPQEEMEARSFEQAHWWQEIASTLLRKYCDRFYKVRKAEFEKDHLEYRMFTGDDPNFIDDYLFLIDQSHRDIVTKLEEIKGIIEKGELRNVDFQGLNAVMFGQHLYQPLVYVNSDVIELNPVPLNEGERDFVLDLQQHCSQNKDFFRGKELYLLQNMSRGRGIGFFEAGNFYPHFILWLLVDEKQYINFIDPKGLRNLKGPDDPKIAFYKTIKSIEDDLRSQDSMVKLNSFIVSNTCLPEVGWWDGGMTKE